MMAHGENAAQPNHNRSGKEYWKSRLYRHGECLGRYTKRLTHRKERREAEQAVKDDLMANGVTE